MGLTPARGFSLVELVIAMGLTTAVLAGVFAALQRSHVRFAEESETIDAQQRARVAADALQRDLTAAAAVFPRRLYPVGVDPPGAFRRDALTLIAPRGDAADSTIADGIASTSVTVLVNLDPGCPVGDPACGFAAGDAVAVCDPINGFDPFVVTGVSGAALTLAHAAADSVAVHPAGSRIVRSLVRSYFLDVDAATGVGQLVRQDAGGSIVPVVDRVEDVTFEHFAAGGGTPLAIGSDPREISRVAAAVRIGSPDGDLIVRLAASLRNLGGTP